MQARNEELGWPYQLNFPDRESTHVTASYFAQGSVSHHNAMVVADIKIPLGAFVMIQIERLVSKVAFPTIEGTNILYIGEAQIPQVQNMRGPVRQAKFLWRQCGWRRLLSLATNSFTISALDSTWSGGMWSS